MKRTCKQLLALVLAIVMVIGILPTIAFAAEEEEPTADELVSVVTPENEAILQEDILNDIDAFFELSAKRDEERTIEDYIAATDDIAEMVLASDTYVEGSMLEVGDGFFWQTTTGITCGYFPYQRYEEDGYVAPIPTRNATASALTAFNASTATNADVCLVCPMYSEDSTFKETYGNETKEIATARGGKGWKLLNTDATVTNIAKAFETCGVVIFDSHGNTDWGFFDGGSDGTGKADNVSKANTSYLCLSSGEGMTEADMAYVTGTYGSYCHAYSSTSGYYVADGTAIANHMTKNAPNSLLWMAICLGQSTNGLNAPLLAKGVNTVYGYSQSVSFVGDYAYEAVFWDNMIAGKTMAQSISAMKAKYGNWDYSTTMLSALGYSTSQGYATLSAAKANYAAFPIVASKEDTYPGQGKVDALQTVTTTMTLSDYGYTSTEPDPTEPTTTEPAETVTVNFSVPAGVSQVASMSCDKGSAITLPSSVTGTPTNDANSSTFVGWAAATVDNSTTAPTYYAAGSSYTVTDNVTLYALYTYGGGANEDGTFYAMSAGDTLNDGDEIVIAANGTSYCLQLANPSSSTTYLNYYDFSAGSVTSACIVGVTASGSGWKLGDSTQGYLYNSSSNYLTVNTSSASTWTLTDNGDGTFYLTANNRYLTCRTDLTSTSANFWRVASTSSTGTAKLDIYRRSATATVYTTEFNAVACDHASTHVTGATAATCTTDGYTGDTVCDSCGATVATGTAIPATGHSYVTTTVAPTATEQGYDHHVCSVCGNTYDDNYVAALGVDYTVSFSVPAGVDQVASMTCNSNGSITLPTVSGTPTNDTKSSTFIGWAAAAVDNSTTAPTYYAAGDSYTATANVTLYALYTYGGSADSSTSLTRMQAGETLNSGDQIVIRANGTDYALKLSSTYSSYVDYYTISDGTVDSLCILDVTASGSGWKLGDATNGYLYNSSSNNLYASTSNASTWTLVDNGDNTFYLKANSRYLSCRTDLTSSYANYWRMASGSTTGVSALIIYRHAASGATYTTIFSEVACQHTNTAVEGAKAPTCTEAGYTGDTVCQDCGVTVAAGSTIAATGHTWVQATSGENYLAPTCTETGLAYKVCSVCNAVGDSVELPALGHNMVAGTVHAPTCTEDGYTEYACSRCTATDIDDIVSATGHTEGAPVDNGDGTHSISCTVCKVVLRTEDHTFTNGTCVCGATEAVTGPVYDANLTFRYNSFTMGSTLNMVYIVSAGTNSYADVRAVVTKYNADGTTTEKTYSIADGTMKDSGSFSTFTFDGIAAKELGDTFVAKLYATGTDGTEYYGAEKTLSLKDFLLPYAQGSDSAQKDLAVALLNYGAAAQVYFGYNYDEADPTTLVNNDLTADQKVIDIREASASVTISGDGAKNVYNTVLLESKIVLYAIFNLSDYSSRIGELSAVVTNTETGETVATLPVTAMGTNGSFRFDDVSAKNTRTVFSIAIYDGETKVSQDLQWSIECMVSGCRADSNATQAKLDLANAILAYGDYAAAYLG